jgi:hypothetical protein
LSMALTTRTSTMVGSKASVVEELMVFAMLVCGPIDGGADD